jgi:2-phospho-L-lactate guanylyltransferase
MIGAIAIVPVKRFAVGKRRLAGAVEEAPRRELIEAMLRDVLTAISEARMVDRTLVVTREPGAERVATEMGLDVVPDPAESGHSQAAELGIDAAARWEPRQVALLPGDCPLLDPRELDGLLTGVPDPYVAVVPDRHGTGTNGLVLSPPDAIRPSFGEGSRERHVLAARHAGLPYSVESIDSLALDVDTPADLIALTTALESGRGKARHTARALGI